MHLEERVMLRIEEMAGKMRQLKNRATAIEKSYAECDLAGLHQKLKSWTSSSDKGPLFGNNGEQYKTN